MKSGSIKAPPHNILICRADKLGDFVLSLPSFVLLKSALPDTKIIALTQEYTKPIAELCDAIDEIITIPKSEPDSKSVITTIRNTIAVIKPLKFDASISLFTTATLAIGLLLSKIPFRLSPATKIDQLFYNFKLSQRRSQSLKPEFEYNLDLIKHYLTLNNIQYNEHFERPLIKFSDNELLTTKEAFITNNNIPTTNKLIFVHVGSGGSANNLSPEQYAKLIKLLSDKLKATFILCEGPEDAVNVDKTIASLTSIKVIRYVSNQGLREFSKHIAIADFFISGSTGPLHIAGALDIPTAGFYPNRRSATSTRWKTLNSDEKLLAFSPEYKMENKIEDNMSDINLDNVAKMIVKKLN